MGLQKQAHYLEGANMHYLGLTAGSTFPLPSNKISPLSGSHHIPSIAIRTLVFPQPVGPQIKLTAPSWKRNSPSICNLKFLLRPGVTVPKWGLFQVNVASRSSGAFRGKEAMTSAMKSCVSDFEKSSPCQRSALVGTATLITYTAQVSSDSIQ